MSVTPNLRTRIRFANKGVVARHSAVIIQPQNFSRQRIQLLRQLSFGRITSRDIEFAVRAKSQTASGMKLRRGNALNNHFAISKAARRLAITHDPHLCAARVVCVGKIKEMVRSKLRMQRDAHQSALAARLDIWNCEKRLRS